MYSQATLRLHHRKCAATVNRPWLWSRHILGRLTLSWLNETVRKRYIFWVHVKCSTAIARTGESMVNMDELPSHFIE